MSNGTQIRRKWALASCLSWSLNVIASDTDGSATCDFILVIHSNNLAPFRDKRRFRSKMQIFPVYLRIPLTGSRWHLITSVDLLTTRMIPLPDCQQVRNMCILLVTVPALDGKIDRQTDGQKLSNNIALCILPLLTCDKNKSRLQ